MAWQSGQLSTPGNSTTAVGFTFGQGVDIPIGKIAAESQSIGTGCRSNNSKRDVQTIRDYNNSFRELNDRVVPILQDVSGLDLGRRRSSGRTGSSIRSASNLLPPRLRNRRLGLRRFLSTTCPRRFPSAALSLPSSVSRMSCFGGGTLVHTLSGTRPIQRPQGRRPGLDAEHQDRLARLPSRPGRASQSTEQDVQGLTGRRDHCQ